jgi:hypothetical protein
VGWCLPSKGEALSSNPIPQKRPGWGRVRDGEPAPVRCSSKYRIWGLQQSYYEVIFPFLLQKEKTVKNGSQSLAKVTLLANGKTGVELISDSKSLGRKCTLECELQRPF